MHVVIFEGSRWPSFAPISLSRPVFTLRSGLCTILEKSVRWMRPSRLTLWVRPGLADWCRRHVVPLLPVPTVVNEPLDSEPALLCSGRTLHFGPFEYPDAPCVALDENQMVTTARVVSPGLSPDDCLNRTAPWMRIRDLPSVNPQGRLPGYVWDLISWNEESILADTVHLREHRNPHPAGSYHVINDKDVYIGKGVDLEVGCVLDASHGPIVLDESVAIGAHAVLKGPCYIGKHSQIMPLACIKMGTTIGPGCKIGGEVSNSIITGFSNKAHDGFLGDSYLGEWINLGAGTITSNLKNTYGAIRVRVGKQEIQTERQFLGSIIGDHTKTAIGTRFMSGSYVGYCCVLATSAFAPVFTPSFSFITESKRESYRLGKAREVMGAVFARRGKNWSNDDQEMLDYVAETAPGVELG